MKYFIILLGLSLMQINCDGQTCTDLPTRFSSYDYAIKIVKKSDFTFTDYLPSGNSTWIMSANYYSCDNIKGYFVYTTIKGGKYIHANVPKYIWLSFKNATSKGSYYNKNIKGKYSLSLN